MVEEGENGYLINDNDLDTLTKTVLKYLTLPLETKQAWRNKSTELFEQHFTLTIMGEKITSTYLSLLSKIKNKHPHIQNKLNNLKHSL